MTSTARLDRLKQLEFQEYALAIVVVLIFVAGTILEPDTFPTWDNIRNMLTQASVIGVLAIGMTFVIATAGIDLSVGSIVAAAGVFGGVMLGAEGTSTLVFIVMAVGFATLLGLDQRGGRGLRARCAVHRDPGDVLDRQGHRPAAQRQAAGQPAGPQRRQLRRARDLLAALVRQWPDSRDPGIGIRLPRDHGGRLGAPQSHRYGRNVVAVGGNREAARIAGVPVRRTILSVYVLMGLLAGIATVLLCARLGSASPVSGNLYELDAIGAVVIGGTSLAGGRASIVGTFLGVLTFALIFSLMTQMNLSTEVQQVTKGVIVLGAVLLQRPEARY